MAIPCSFAFWNSGYWVDIQHILDLGCGQGLLAAWLFAARDPSVSSVWPTAWPAAPHPVSIRGIELRARDVWRAQRALGGKAQFVVDDIRTAEYGSADAVVLLDVLHFMDYRAQEQVLRRVRAALCTGGVLYLRVGDAAGGIRFRISKCVDQVVLFALERRRPRLFCRSLRDWQQVLAESGFQSEAMQMSEGTLLCQRAVELSPGMTELVFATFTAVSCIGRGQAEQLEALRAQRTGLAPCAFETVDLNTCIGEVAGVDAVRLPADLQEFDCRNNRLAQLTLQQDGFAEAVHASVGRWGRRRIGVFLGTSTSGILQAELAYRRRDPRTGALPGDFNYRGTQNTFSAADFVRRALRLEGPATVVSSGVLFQRQGIRQCTADD